MTDKLADALKHIKRMCELRQVGIDHLNIINLVDAVLRDHEATPTPADVQEAVRRFNARVCISTRDGMILEWHETPDGTHVLYEDYAALRAQGVTLPMEVRDVLMTARGTFEIFRSTPKGEWQSHNVLKDTFTDLIGRVDKALALLDQHARGG